MNFKTLIAVLVALPVLIFVSYTLTTYPPLSEKDEPKAEFVADSVINSEPAAGEEIVSEGSEEDIQMAAVDTEQVVETESTESNDPGSFLPIRDRTLGDENAPITMYEFSSLSCGHCGGFHKHTYPTLKEEYVETGKVKIVVIDFPTSLPALEGVMLAHCMPEQQYFNFLQLLFTTQENWLSSDYKTNLLQNASLAGMSKESAEACLNDEALKEAMLKRTENAQTKWNVSSTPSFVFNDGVEMIVGNRPYEDFKAVLDRLLAESDS